jgi:hypothetical protein
LHFFAAAAAACSLFFFLHFFVFGRANGCSGDANAGGPVKVTETDLA